MSRFAETEPFEPFAETEPFKPFPETEPFDYNVNGTHTHTAVCDPEPACWRIPPRLTVEVCKIILLAAPIPSKI